MKSVQKHLIPYFRCSLILSGIVLCSLLTFEIQCDGNNFADLTGFATGYLSENDGNASEEKDVNHSNHIFELVYKETAEKKKSFPDTNGLAVLKQGIQHIEVASVNFSLDRSLLFKGMKLLSKDFSPGFINHTPTHYFSYLLFLTGDIAINAP